MLQGSRRRGIPAAGYPVSATAGGNPNMAPYPQPPSGPVSAPPVTRTVTPLKEKAKREDAQADIVSGPIGLPSCVFRLLCSRVITVQILRFMALVLRLLEHWHIDYHNLCL